MCGLLAKRRALAFRREVIYPRSAHRSSMTCAYSALPRDCGTTMRWLPVLAIALVLPACSRFGVRDAASRIALSRHCDSMELSVVQEHRGLFSAVGCGEHGVWQCQGGLCRGSDGDGATAPRTPGRVAHALVIADVLKDEVLACTRQRTVLVQVLIAPDGRPRQVAMRPLLDQASYDCVRHIILERFRVPGFGGEMLFSHRFEQSTQSRPWWQNAPAAE